MNTEKKTAENKNEKTKKFYRIIYTIAFLPISLLYRVTAMGRENIPCDGAIYCANHSCWVDPFLIAFALTKKKTVHFMAKVELFKGKFLSFFMHGMGMIPVNRGKTDLNCIKESLRLLREGENLSIFPEGTRVSEDDAVTAKNGAIKIAEKSGRPIVPVYIPRKKHLFGRVKLVFGEPFYVNPERKRLTPAEYEELAQKLMGTIKNLGTVNR